MTLEFGAPLWLAALLVLPLHWLLTRTRAGGIAYPRSGELGRGAARARWLARTPDLLRALVLSTIVLALARPRTPGAVVEERTAGVPIVIALDVSSSMLIEDFGPRNRMTVAKQNVARFVEMREDPVGLVAFAAEALTLVPITTYDAVTINALRSLRVGLLEDGTAVGEGLAIAINRLRQAPGESKVIILMSDGESNRGQIDPVQAAQAAALNGIQVFTIGVGSRGIARVPVARGPNGIRYARLPVGFDESLLREIARITGGQYFRATDPRALRDVYARIDQLVQTPLETRRRVLYTEWHVLFLVAAAALLVMEWLLRGSRWGAVPA